MIQIDIEKIINEIREEIKDKGYTDDLLSFKDCCRSGIDVEEMLVKSYETQNYAYIEEYPDWKINTFRDRIEVFFKKIFRKTMKFYIVPITEKQNVFNLMTGERLVEYATCLSENQEELERIRKRLLELEKKCSNLEK